MKSPHSTIPNVTVTSTPEGYDVTCSACGHVGTRMWRAAASVLMFEHEAECARVDGEPKWRDG